MIHALIVNGTVTDLIRLVPGTPYPGAVPCGDIPAAIGDSYENGCFWRNGQMLESPYEAEKHLREEMDAAYVWLAWQLALLEAGIGDDSADTEKTGKAEETEA